MGSPLTLMTSGDMGDVIALKWLPVLWNVKWWHAVPRLVDVGLVKVSCSILQNYFLWMGRSAGKGIWAGSHQCTNDSKRLIFPVRGCNSYVDKNQMVENFIRKNSLICVLDSCYLKLCSSSVCRYLFLICSESRNVCFSFILTYNHLFLIWKL